MVGSLRQRPAGGGASAPGGEATGGAISAKGFSLVKATFEALGYLLCATAGLLMLWAYNRYYR